MISIIAYWLIHCEDNTLDEEKTDEEINSFLKTKSLSKDGEHPITDKQFNALSPKYKRILYTAITRTHNLCDVSKIDVKDVTNIDLVTYSFPCQDISNRGKKLGFDAGSGTRSALVWKVGELLDNMKSNISSCGKMPKFLLMENVKAIVSDNNISNFNVWIEKLNSLGYFSKYFLIDAKDFGAPQSRNRCFMISVFVGEDEE
jgi:DNA (cytosine-5)-methyltransferase 1